MYVQLEGLGGISNVSLTRFEAHLCLAYIASTVANERPHIACRWHREEEESDLYVESDAFVAH